MGWTIYQFTRYDVCRKFNVLFGKINGRFVSSEMIGNYKINDIKEFYTSVLPNLGWEKVNENLFQRDGEFLEIELKLMMTYQR